MMKVGEILTGIILILLVLILLIPLYELHSKLVDALAQLSADMATGVFDALGLKK